MQHVLCSIVDIDNNFRNPITNTRTYGSDPKRVLKMAQAQRKGLEENHVIPVIKHFLVMVLMNATNICYQVSIVCQLKTGQVLTDTFIKPLSTKESHLS